MADLNVKISDLQLKSPVMTASGTFGYGLELADFVPLEEVGGTIVKDTTLESHEENNYSCMVETPQGMFNCAGPQNKRMDYFIGHIYPQIKDIDTNMIANVSGNSPESYAETAEKLDTLEGIPAIEANTSCPNVKEGGMSFGVTCPGAASIAKTVRQHYHKIMIVKLLPNVTDIASIVRVCEDEGADSVSLINTLVGMAIDIEHHRPKLSIRTGGLSGPVVKSVAVRMVNDIAKAVRIPIIDLGGISTVEDAIEFLMVEATAAQTGTMNFTDSQVTIKVRDDINDWPDCHGCKSVTEIINCLV